MAQRPGGRCCAAKDVRVASHARVGVGLRNNKQGPFCFMQADASQQKREIGSGAFLTSYASIWLCAAAAFACAACSSDPPYRKLLEAHSSTWEAVYEHATWNDAAGRKDDAAEMARVRKLIKADLNNPQ